MAIWRGQEHKKSPYFPPLWPLPLHIRWSPGFIAGLSHGGFQGGALQNGWLISWKILLDDSGIPQGYHETCKWSMHFGHCHGWPCLALKHPIWRGKYGPPGGGQQRSATYHLKPGILAAANITPHEPIHYVKPPPNDPTP